MLHEETPKRESVWLNQEVINHQYGYYFFKRLIDIFCSVVGLLFLLPIFLWVVYKIREEEPGSPVFFKQTRIGKNGQPFEMFKFRSMCVDAEKRLESLLDQNEIKGAMFKMKNDPRITKFGKFMRARSIDELPQLWNVLAGDMSLVGPRPPLIREVAKYTDYDLQRLYVKPGCSGLWQVSGRNELDFEEMVELDVDYISHQSIVNDIKIMAKTFDTLFHSFGAY
jgi:lipopolysaccharide/colanic/teichoic acid biosynthesis glycosyltransferase